MYTQFKDDPTRYPGHNSKDKPNVFSGTSANGVYAYEIVSGNTGSDPGGEAFEILFGVPYVIIDFPLSLVADIILLPLTITKQFTCGSLAECEKMKD